MTFTPFACAVSTTAFTASSPVNASTSTRSTSPVFCRILIQFYISFCLNGFLPPSLDVRNVKRIGVSPSTSRRAFIVSSVFAKSKISSYQSTRHSTTSAFVDLIVSAAERISSLVTPTIGTQIFGIPAPISIFLTFYSIHDSIPFYDFFGGKPAPAVLLRYRFHFYNFLIYASSAFFRSTPYLTFTKSPSATPTAVRTMFITITCAGCILDAAVRIV